MATALRSTIITELTWVDVRDRLESDGRLLVPIGTCDQYGLHLPIGASTMIVEALARDLAEEFGVLRAPTFTYGVNVPSADRYAGAAGLREKTLHRALNDLLACWEAQGFREFILLTAHRYDAHVEAIAGVAVAEARVRVIETLAIDLTGLVDAPPGPRHGGEIETSLLLHLRPDAVHMERAENFTLPPPKLPQLTGARTRITSLPEGAPGSLGYPTLASAEKGERIYAHILEKIRERVFSAPTEDS